MSIFDHDFATFFGDFDDFHDRVQPGQNKILLFFWKVRILPKVLLYKNNLSRKNFFHFLTSKLVMNFI